MLLNEWGPLNTWVAEAAAAVAATVPEAGGALGRSGQRRPRKLRQNDEDFLTIIELALPEIVKHLDKS